MKSGRVGSKANRFATWVRMNVLCFRMIFAARTLTRGPTIASNNGYFVPLRTPNTTFPDNYFYGFSFIHKLFKDKMTLTASVTNFLEEKRKLTSITENENFITENRNRVAFRNFGLALSYNFGRLKENVSKKKGVNNDDQVQ